MLGAHGRAFAFAFVATMLLVAGQAWGATRYAEPAPGDGDPNVCSQADPCNLQNAVEDGSVNPGDEVVVLPGDYAIGTNSIDPPVAIDLHGAAGQPRPTIMSTATSTSAAVQIDVPGVLIRDLRIEHSGGPGGAALDIQEASTAERVIATSSANIACLPAFGALIRDSICHSTADGEAAVRFIYSGAFGPTAPSSTATLINVTAVASVGNSNAIDLQTQDVGVQTLNGRNVIANGNGTGADVSAGNGGASVTINLDHSNYDTQNEVGVNATVTDPGSGTNQLAAPQFVGADFHQAGSSPTIDAGAGDPLLGSADIDGEARSQGGAPDIGADEFTVPPPAANGDTFPPDTKILKGPKKRTKKRKAKFQFGGSEPGLTFECSLDHKAFKPCDSPEKYRSLKRTKHVFAVRAVDAAGNRDPTPADRKWSIRKKKK
jgi:hypothetical protein